MAFVEVYTVEVYTELTVQKGLASLDLLHWGTNSHPFPQLDRRTRLRCRRGGMKVIVADKISERGVTLLKEQDGWTTVLTTKETLEAEITDADALIVRSATKVTEHLLARAPKLRAVGRAGVGVDNINLEAATKRGVLVMSTPGGNSVSVAEHTFALLLSLARQVPRLDRAIHEGRWEKSSAAGTEVRGKKIGRAHV